MGSGRGQRGSLLTGRDEYLVPYREALPKLDQTLTRLRELTRTIGTPELREAASRLDTLVGKKLAEMEAMLSLNERSGRDVAFELMNTGIGRRTMDSIRAEVALMVRQQREVWSEGATRWIRRTSPRSAVRIAPSLDPYRWQATMMSHRPTPRALLRPRRAA